MTLLTGLPLKHFKCVAADVPWEYKTRSAKGKGRSAEKHYGVMSLEEITALPVAAHVADDAFLFFWVTGPFLAIGAHIPIMREWGFEPTAMGFDWWKIKKKYYDKPVQWANDHLFKVGMGHTTRQNPEWVVLGRRGDPKRLSKAVRAVIIEPAREHSRKPEKFYERAEKFCAGPRLDLFGRSQRPGWIVRGNESNKFKIGE